MKNMQYRTNKESDRKLGSAVAVSSVEKDRVAPSTAATTTTRISQQSIQNNRHLINICGWRTGQAVIIYRLMCVAAGSALSPRTYSYILSELAQRYLPPCETTILVLGRLENPSIDVSSGGDGGW
ncbi:hypothetical protein CBL_09616 [Carabus blaptoides fortunei]